MPSEYSEREMRKVICVLLFLLGGLEQAFSDPHALVFVHIGGNLPAYVETAIHQARLFNKECPIYLVGNAGALSSFSEKMADPYLRLVSCESLNRTAEHRRFIKRSRLDKHWAGGFWNHATERFFYLYDLMLEYQLENVFHLENDNMLYADVQELLPIFRQYYPEIGATFDNEERFIGGFVYIHNASSLLPLVTYLAGHAHEGRYEMQVIAQFKEERERSQIDYLPIIHSEYVAANPLVSPFGHRARDPQSFCNRVDVFDSIFDAAALGQYLGGIDPRNGPSVPGFINESCVFNPSLLTYEWQCDAEGRNVPYAIYAGRKRRINNLHIHSKRLYEFSSK
jgi:hypothetical protein